LLGKPPILIAGMTPTTSFNGGELVAAVNNAGYHGELAAGGLPRKNIFREKVGELEAILDPHAGIHVNLLFLNPKQWAFQFPLCMQMRGEGAPIESLTVAAGVPSLGKANEIIEKMRAARMRYVSFKPGSVNAIRSVVEIAAANPDFTVMLQWTGGRAGGHHSFEDMHAPVIRTYALMRSAANIILVAGSGIGDADGAVRYLTGEWSVSVAHFMYRYISRVSCSQFDSLPLTYLTGLSPSRRATGRRCRSTACSWRRA
jgi:fatty acid synthase subunit beta